VASGCAELTIPFVPTAGRVGVFLLAGPSAGAGSRDEAGSSTRAVVSPSVEPPPGESFASTVAFSPEAFSPEAFSRGVGC
jgi:hypothetical protein